MILICLTLIINLILTFGEIKNHSLLHPPGLSTYATLTQISFRSNSPRIFSDYFRSPAI